MVLGRGVLPPQVKAGQAGQRRSARRPAAVKPGVLLSEHNRGLSVPRRCGGRVRRLTGRSPRCCARTRACGLVFAHRERQRGNHPAYAGWGWNGTIPLDEAARKGLILRRIDQWREAVDMQHERLTSPDDRHGGLDLHFSRRHALLLLQPKFKCVVPPHSHLTPPVGGPAKTASSFFTAT